MLRSLARADQIRGDARYLAQGTVRKVPCATYKVEGRRYMVQGTRYKAKIEGTRYKVQVRPKTDPETRPKGEEIWVRKFVKKEKLLVEKCIPNPSKKASKDV